MPTVADSADSHVPDPELSFERFFAGNSNSWKGDIVCFSHLRWGFVFQRPNHLMARFAKQQRVFFVEEPVYDDVERAHLETRTSPEGVVVCVPHLPRATDAPSSLDLMSRLFRQLRGEHGIDPDVFWFYTPMALEWARHERARVVVYDCMDELSAFLGAPPALVSLEKELLSRADLVFTGGVSLFEAKRHLHQSVHAFPSSVDAAHFSRARAHPPNEPDDQRTIPHPRLGFFGVIDERIDFDLIEQLCRARPDLQLILVGPVVKVDPAGLPRAPNIHWLGMKSYGELPDYIVGWEVAIMPFALNAATRFISPTKTLEYLAAGLPVVSTAVPDVVHPYAALRLVRIADASTFAAAVDAALADRREEHWSRADRYLETTSWDRTWRAMTDLVEWRLLQHQPSKGRTECTTT